MQLEKLPKTAKETGKSKEKGTVNKLATFNILSYCFNALMCHGNKIPEVGTNTSQISRFALPISVR